MTADELIVGIRGRITDPSRRTDMTTEEAPPLYATASMEALEIAENELGFPIVGLLRRLYTEVANGGFGPGEGILGIADGHGDADGRPVSALYAELRAQGWPEGLVPLCDWGCGAWACVDEHGRVVTMDEHGPTKTSYTLHSWLEAWLSGVDLLAGTFELVDDVMVNPFTKEPMVVKRRGRARGEGSSP
jgi:hypothetical protein